MLDALAAEHPFDERVRGQLGLALYRSGRQTEALQTYREYRRRLSAEPGLEPGEALRTLERRILSHDPQLAAPERIDRPGERAPTATRSRKQTLLVAAAAIVLVLAAVAGVLQAARSGGEGGLAGVNSNSVAVIDPDTNRIVGQIAVGNSPTRIAVGGKSLWMVNWGALTRVDPATNTLARRSYDVGLDGRIAADDRFVWIADEFGDSVWQIDAGNWRVVRSIQVGSVPSGVAIGFGSIWVSSGDGTVTRIDPVSGRVLAVVRTGRAARGIAAGKGAIWVSVA